MKKQEDLAWGVGEQVHGDWSARGAKIEPVAPGDDACRVQTVAGVPFKLVAAPLQHDGAVA
jgi:hypothetical protein